MREMVAKVQLWREVLNSLMESMWKYIKTNYGWKPKLNMIIIDSTMMTTCMPIFSNFFWIFNLSQNFPPWHRFHFVKTVHAVL
jgi:hypothetical protein